jgi:hypothetical protein
VLISRSLFYHHFHPIIGAITHNHPLIASSSLTIIKHPLPIHQITAIPQLPAFEFLHTFPTITSFVADRLPFACRSKSKTHKSLDKIKSKEISFQPQKERTCDSPPTTTRQTKEENNKGFVICLSLSLCFSATGTNSNSSHAVATLSLKINDEKVA